MSSSGGAEAPRDSNPFLYSQPLHQQPGIQPRLQRQGVPRPNTSGTGSRRGRDAPLGSRQCSGPKSSSGGAEALRSRIPATTNNYRSDTARRIRGGGPTSSSGGVKAPRFTPTFHTSQGTSNLRGTEGRQHASGPKSSSGGAKSLRHHIPAEASVSRKHLLPSRRSQRRDPRRRCTEEDSSWPAGQHQQRSSRPSSSSGGAEALR